MHKCYFCEIDNMVCARFENGYFFCKTTDVLLYDDREAIAIYLHNTYIWDFPETKRLLLAQLSSKQAFGWCEDS